MTPTKDNAMLADRIESHVRFLANTRMEMPLGTWNAISNDLLSAATALRLASTPAASGVGWQDISSAPKDGTEVLVWCDEGIDIAKYSKEEPDGSDSMGHDAGWWGVHQPMDPGRHMGNPAYFREAENQPWAWMQKPEPPYDEDGEPLFSRPSSQAPLTGDGSTSVAGLDGGGRI